MDEPRQEDGASLTDQVRLFRRMARLAVVDPLRLLPIDALTRLASLSGPAAELIELAPFERLRAAIGAPAAAAGRQTPRKGPRPFASAGNDILRTAAATASTPAARVSGRNAAPGAAQPEPASAPSSLQLAGEALRRAAAPASLAERRAELRRRSVDAGSPAAASAPVRQEMAATGSRGVSANEGRAIDPADRSRTVRSEEIASQRRRVRSESLDPKPIDRDDVASVSSNPQSAAAGPATNQAPATGDVRATSARTDRLSDAASATAVDPPSEREMPAVLPGHHADDSGSAGIPPAHSWSVSGPWPQAARRPQADTADGLRRRAWEPDRDSELADSLFETLYRDGVDLPWP